MESSSYSLESFGRPVESPPELFDCPLESFDRNMGSFGHHWNRPAATNRLVIRCHAEGRSLLADLQTQWGTGSVIIP